MFRRTNSSFGTLLIAATCTAILTVGAGVNAARAIGLVYVEADPLSGNIVPGSAFESPQINDSNLWGGRTGFGANSTIFESAIAEDSPELTQTIMGLTPGNSYDVYGVYWTDQDENWTLGAGLASGATTLFSFTGNSGTYPVAGSTQGVAASLAVWDLPPPPGPGAIGDTLYLQRASNPLVMLLGKAGTGVADGSGNLEVFLEDNPNNGQSGRRRTWLDGVAYVDVTGGAVPIAATATLDRSTGSLTLNNPTSQNIDIKNVHIEAAVTGVFNATAWTSISSTNASWTITGPPDPPNTPYASVLEEDGGGTTVTLASNGGSLSIGNVWNKTPYDHVLIWLTLADDSLAVLAPQYTGAAVEYGDFDAVGGITLTDYQTLMTNLHTNGGALTTVEHYIRGDMTGDGLINFADFAAFRAAYDLAHGAGAFAQMAAQVPEPGTLALLFIGGILTLGFRKRCRPMVTVICALLVCLLTTRQSQAVPVLAVDFDDRTVVDAPNTVAGFESFILTGTTASVSTSVTRNLAGFSVTLVPFDDHLDENNVTAGLQDTVGAVDDRDRTAPVDGGALTYAQIYDDFIFAGASTGPTGGADVTISGGTLVANKPYVVSIYSYDVSSAGIHSADYYDATNTVAPILSTFWAGATANNPTTNDQYKFSGIAQTNGSGELILQGRASVGYAAAGGAITGVFLNGFEINEFTGLTLEVNTLTGATRFLNEQGSTLSLSYYEIRSNSGALSLAGWNSLDNQEGGDPVGTGWDVAGGSSANILSEGNLESQLDIAASADKSLGDAFSAAGLHDLRFFYAEATDTSLRPGFVKYFTPSIAGDHNGDGKVNAADYVLWRKNPGAYGGDPAGYNAWRANFGNPPGSGSSLGGDAAIPEPAGVVMLLVGALAMYAHERFRPRAE